MERHRRFILRRIVDVSGVSGLGDDPEQAERLASYLRGYQVEHVHGHSGATVIEWLDPE